MRAQLSSFEADINTLYNMENRVRKPKPLLAYLKAVLDTMFFEINSFTKLIQRLRNSLELAASVHANKDRFLFIVCCAR